MKTPNFETAVVPLDKVIDYLLNHDHSDGNSKARFFSQLGFDEETLPNMLLTHISEHDFVEKIRTKYGVKYIIIGIAESPIGVRFNLKTIWIVAAGTTFPRLITAYPSKS